MDTAAEPAAEHLRGAGPDALAHRQALSPQFTQRQLEVLSLLGEGLPTKLICRRLDIAAGTVKVHIRFILRKLGVSSRLQAVVVAHRYGLLDGHGAVAPGQAATSGPIDPSAPGTPRRFTVVA